MMTKKTAEMIAKARAMFGDKLFTALQWERAIDLSLATAAKYDAVTTVEEVNKTVAFNSIDAFIKFVNGLAGEDCYYCDWNYVAGDDGKIYNVTTTTYYKMT